MRTAERKAAKSRIPSLWVAARKFSGFGRKRRLAKDFEDLAGTLETFVTLAAIRRLART